MILLEHRGKYYNTDRIVGIYAKRTGDLDITEIRFYNHELIILDVPVEYFLFDLSEVYKTAKKFAIFSVSREGAPVEKVPNPRP